MNFSLDNLGKLIGLLMSVLFFVVATWYLVSGSAAAAAAGQQQVFFALMIILGGPIPYFFVSTTTSLSLRTPLGICTVGGGYVIAIFAVYYVTNLMPEREVWRHFTLDNLEQNVESKAIQIWGATGDVELIKEEPEDHRPFEFVCCFRANSLKTVITIQIPQPNGPKLIKQPLVRNGGPSKQFYSIRTPGNPMAWMSALRYEILSVLPPSVSVDRLPVFASFSTKDLRGAI